MPVKRKADGCPGQPKQPRISTRAFMAPLDQGRTPVAKDLKVEIAGSEDIVISGLPSLSLLELGGSGLAAGKWRLPASSLGAALRLGGFSPTLKASLPSWVLAGLGKEFAKFHEPLQLPKKTARVIQKEAQDITSSSSSSCVGLPALEEWRSSEGDLLLPYQREGVQFGLRNHGRVLLGDEMGLGKTAQALVLAAHFREDWPLLVICPSSLGRSWAEEARKWLPAAVLGPGDDAIQVVVKGSDVPRRLAQVFIVPYDLFVRQPKFQCHRGDEKFRTVICDEAHMLKSTASQRSKAIRPVLQTARRAILLTGTPAVNNAAELYPLIDSLLPGLIPSEIAFLRRYCVERIFKAGGRAWQGSTRPDELHRLLSSTVMVRRQKAQVLPQLPRKRRQQIQLEPSKLRRESVAEIAEIRRAWARSKQLDSTGETSDLKQLLMMDEGLNKVTRTSGRSGHSLTQQQAVAEMARLTCEAKQEAACDYAALLCQSGSRFLLFAHHHAMLNSLESCLTKQGIHFVRIDGSTPAALRAERVAQFQSADGPQVALLSITAAGQGLNLQAAALVVFAELHWVVGQMLQAEDRAHRVGQRSSVNIHYLIAPGTLDEAMFETIKRKHLDTTATLDGDRKVLQLDILDARQRTMESYLTQRPTPSSLNDSSLGGA